MPPVLQHSFVVYITHSPYNILPVMTCAVNLNNNNNNNNNNNESIKCKTLGAYCIMAMPLCVIGHASRCSHTLGAVSSRSNTG